jgi:HPt (histidine-containing phosphotransfer) domain-containing protein
MHGVDAAASDPLDPGVIAAIRSLGEPGEPDVYAEVARLFLADVPRQLAALRVAIDTACPELVAQIAHRLRGGALEIGAVRMAPVCATIEHAARSLTLDQAAGTAARLEVEFAAARSALERTIA